MSTARWSLRRRLLVAIGGAAVLVWCASSFWLYREAIAETDHGFDVALDHTAHAVLAIVANEMHELRLQAVRAISSAEPLIVAMPTGSAAIREPGTRRVHRSDC